MIVDWVPLRRALADLRHEGVPLPIWWRDDDAVAQTPALERLSAVAERLSFPVHLAIIPKRAGADLTRYLANTDAMIPVTHGWTHDNHAPSDRKKSEFGLPRVDGAAEINQAMTRMTRLFGKRFLPLFVPPWNRLDPCHYPALQSAGFAAVSLFGPRPEVRTDNGLIRINTHIDPIDWRGSRDLTDPNHLVAIAVRNLEARRTGSADASEPLGYLTHHLVHSENLWEFSGQILTELLEGGAFVQTLDTLLAANS